MLERISTYNMIMANYYNAIPEYRNPEHRIELREHDMFFNRNYCTYFGLGVAKYPNIPRVSEDVEERVIEGRSGSLTVKKGTYANRTLSFTFRVLDHITFWNRIDEAEEWLVSFTDNRLLYDRNDKCFVVKNVVVGDISKEVKKYGEFEVRFTVNPFMEDLIPTVISFQENDKLVINKGHFSCNPILNLKGNGDLSITINDKTTIIKGVKNEVTLDSELMTCRGQNGENKLIDMIGVFPVIDKGENNIRVNSNVATTTIRFSNYYR